MKKLLASLILFLGLTAAADAQTFRVVLTQPATFYVSPSGSDMNDCTATRPCATAQFVWNMIVTQFDLAGQTVTVQFADGIYPGGVTSTIAPTGGGLILFQGDLSSMQVFFICGTVDCWHFQFNSTTALQFSNMSTVEPSASLTNEYYFNGAINATFTGIQFLGGGTYSVNAINGANVVFDTTNWTFYGSWSGTNAAVIGVFTDATVTISAATINSAGNAIFAQFIYASSGHVNSTGVTFTITGTYTGKRYVADKNGIIDTNGAGATYFPGNAGGTTATQGQYL